MKSRRISQDSYADAPPDALVSFSVVCQPKSGSDLDRMKRELSLETLDQLRPTVQVRAQVVADLRARGFKVAESRGPVVTAQGTVRLFESVFGAKLVQRIRRRVSDGAKRSRTVTSIVLSPDSKRPSPEAIRGAISITVAGKPTPMTPSLPPATAGFHLRVPGDIAQLTRASATHRLSTPSGERATGAGVAVAVVDTGFAEHPYFTEHGYHITRQAASDVTSDPAEDEEVHGTCMVAGLFACAPDVHAFAIKYGGDPVAALETALANAGIKVLSLSWGYDVDGETELPDDYLGLQLQILDIISSGVTVIASAGNGEASFPGMMPEVIAVGGVDVDTADSLAAWEGGSSFLSSIFKGRPVPDLCGVAAEAMLPIPGTRSEKGPPRKRASPPGWESMEGGTSLATSQVAGIAALLLQKVPTLTPQGVRAALMNTSTDVVGGETWFGDSAVPGPDLATGSGFVNALMAWNSV